MNIQTGDDGEEKLPNVTIWEVHVLFWVTPDSVITMFYTTEIIFRSMLVVMALKDSDLGVGVWCRTLPDVSRP